MKGSKDVAWVPVSKELFHATTLEVARHLLGVLLIRQEPQALLVGRICEVEAYTQEDPASHSYRGLTGRNRWMFGPPGRAYVYRIYGMHHCFNVVTGEEGRGEAVLIRAVEPLCGQEQMALRRRLSEKGVILSELLTQKPLLRALCSGPARLCEAFGIDTTFNGVDLTDPHSPLFLAKEREPEVVNAPIIATGRIGIRQGRDRQWRFLRADSPFISRPPKREEREALC
ncbi:DNA-3-methyladenine glycosylase [Chthonomonas calidirosea]|uniref:Putative 3-methyladenine DNA glycosylase n=1 Tax=Chthonomonas calidirosea (strain DSM 23976 / ICMP 18418 / T49) TaxID=1303518 RepID=S0EUW3_CHTCT|nr:DNA-3-methyladenine glycosylase (3mg) [Chthonomonas calidirosea T49]CEK19065.1 DNA-3-methyladenine glycosylase [Chthonomonas calidirosea]CEK20062.1 DNA-3-methyladenine glycosylase [Chthonomonas calidirosea]